VAFYFINIVLLAIAVYKTTIYIASHPPTAKFKKSHSTLSHMISYIQI